jgi:NAD(P)-dependent dehydrogenase (short-subunit alcohol dehydrogenase family)
MTIGSYRRALIVGAGSGLSASLARALTAEGLHVGLAARNADKLAAICAETGAASYACDATDPAAVEALFEAFARDGGAPDVVIYNASGRARGDFETLAPDAVRDAIAVSAFGGFLVGQAAVKRMLPAGTGAVLFTGASASVKGFARSAAFAMGKFALRGLAQSMARELGPKGIHVAHVVIDGGIRSATRLEDPQKPDALLDPDAIAENYLALLRQPKSSWTFELELRPWVETF